MPEGTAICRHPGSCSDRHGDRKVFAMDMGFSIRSVAVAAIVAATGVPAEAAAAEIGQATIFETIEASRHGTLLKARVGGQDGLFLFDTGGGVTIVTPKTARAVGCHPWGQMTGFRATGQRLDTPRCDDVRLSINGQTLLAPSAAVYDINALVDAKAMPILSGLIALDAFAGKTITIRPLAHEIVLETTASLGPRIRHAREIPIRIVRDLEGVALTVDAAVPTAAGRAWMELDTGNLGPVMIGRHVAALLGLDATERAQQEASFSLGGVAQVREPERVSDLIMDGDIGESVLRDWDLTLDLAAGRAWIQPATVNATPPD